MPPLSLLVSTDERLLRVPLPEKRRIVLGRGEGCDVRIDDESMSRRHAVIHVGTRISIEDLGSANGTWVLRRRILAGRHGRSVLPLGASFDLAGTTLIVQARRKVPPDAPPSRAKKKPAAIVVDPAMLRRYALLEVLAQSPLDVLVVGDAGAGKRMFAEALVARSPRAKKPFVVIDCGTLDMKTMAAAAEEAGDGTILLQRVDELPPALGRILGARLESARRIFTAHDDGVALAKAIGGFSIAIPPLRERREDILPLARAFAGRSAAQLGEPVPEISEQAGNALTRHDWSRNVRELQGVMDRALIDADGAAWIDLEHLRLPRYD